MKDTNKVRANSKLRVKRESIPMSQDELAKKAELTAWTIGKIENGQVKPRPSTMRKIANAMGVDVWEIFENFSTAVPMSA